MSLTRAMITAALIALPCIAWAQLPVCVYRKVVITEWHPCGKPIIGGTTMGDHWGVQMGDTVRMDNPSPAQRSVRMFLMVPNHTEGGCRTKGPFPQMHRCDQGRFPE